MNKVNNVISEQLRAIRLDLNLLEQQIDINRLENKQAFLLTNCAYQDIKLMLSLLLCDDEKKAKEYFTRIEVLDEFIKKSMDEFIEKDRCETEDELEHAEK